MFTSKQKLIIGLWTLPEHYCISKCIEVDFMRVSIDDWTRPYIGLSMRECIIIDDNCDGDSRVL